MSNLNVIKTLAVIVSVNTVLAISPMSLRADNTTAPITTNSTTAPTENINGTTPPVDAGDSGESPYTVGLGYGHKQGENSVTVSGAMVKELTEKLGLEITSAIETTKPSGEPTEYKATVGASLDAKILDRGTETKGFSLNLEGEVEAIFPLKKPEEGDRYQSNGTVSVVNEIRRNNHTFTLQLGESKPISNGIVEEAQADGLLVGAAYSYKAGKRMLTFSVARQAARARNEDGGFGRATITTYGIELGNAFRIRSKPVTAVTEVEDIRYSDGSHIRSYFAGMKIGFGKKK